MLYHFRCKTCDTRDTIIVEGFNPPKRPPQCITCKHRMTREYTRNVIPSPMAFRDDINPRITDDEMREWERDYEKNWTVNDEEEEYETAYGHH